MASHEREVVRVGVPRGVNVDPVHRDHAGPKHHRLQVEPPAVGQQARDPGEQSAVDLLLASGVVLLRRAEVLEGAEARDGVEGAEDFAGNLPGPSYLAPLKSTSSPRLSRKMRSISE